jgi:hypothetical protein
MEPFFVLITSVNHSSSAQTNSKELLKHARLEHTWGPTANAQPKFPQIASTLNVSPVTTTASFLTKQLVSTPLVLPALEATTAPTVCTPERSDVVQPATSTLAVLSST